ncbi:MAG: hypothetical protein K2M75_02335, partial [Clostridia bacterium]|nr:hypothetical protein [Clostridia bacterium]
MQSTGFFLDNLYSGIALANTATAMHNKAIAKTCSMPKCKKWSVKECKLDIMKTVYYTHLR